MRRGEITHKSILDMRMVFLVIMGMMGRCTQGGGKWDSCKDLDQEIRCSSE
jgi:hypothetical protein